MNDIALIVALFEDQRRAFPVVHKTGVAIDPVAEVVQQVTQATRNPPLDIRRRDVVSAMDDPFDISTLGRAR